jgi:hypothetical protein
MGRLMHNGKPWTGEGFPPDSPERLAESADVDGGAPCAQHEYEDGRTGWEAEGHAPSWSAGAGGCPRG